MKHEPLEFGRYYHLYNHGVGNRDLFPIELNCEYFLELYVKYIVPIADTFAWALMKNHFHILLKLKDIEEVYPVVDLSGFQNLTGLRKDSDPTGLGDLSGLNGKDLSGISPDRSGQNKKVPDDRSGLQNVKPPSRHFSNFFNAYAKAINKQTGMDGSLFRRPMKRISITGESYLKYLLLYIHTNPVHHEICELPEQYKWTSYNAFFTNQYSFLKWEEPLKWFDDKENFLYMHKKKIDHIRISRWLEIDE
ncbi:MAG: hypothetical protein M0O94_06675 [Bacteroidales bacterium]|nr:hypothetical protein [Bacteroidales bacterium]MDD3962378.1 hypothetical protein [Bacteroidales bacterium]MDY0285632.1 hypothetical protein [Bacteroidales bacterium]